MCYRRFDRRSLPALWLITLLLIDYPVTASEPNADDLPASETANRSADQMRAIADTSGMLILDRGNPVLYYQRRTNSLGGRWPRENYIHPLYGLDGKILSEDFPIDHRHHRGVFWAWHQVWVGDQMLGDPWTCQAFESEVIDVQTSSEGDAISLRTDVRWKSPQMTGSDGEMIPIVAEQAWITVNAAKDGYRPIDFVISLRALVDEVRIGGSDDSKGYGGFSPRIKLEPTQQFRSASGPVEPTTNALQLGGWVDISGNDFGLAIFQHPSNPQPNDLFILRRERSMQNAVYPGRNPVPLSKTEPTTLRYRLIVHRGDLNTNQTAKLYSDYSTVKEPPSAP